ncbi:hypothetical protein Y032_0330g2686 [Ancylostoma ceylanicum]|uniref:G-protein coupled receptors family 1 profile domain-containing protein n=1 Tax=Ancylostoma ceylanicum TaxID=53326 RepID=A0A016RZK8_9BILA|nr:hypothetical protein Y032_0330g2686 [Ancylostoma ceylanicum]
MNNTFHPPVITLQYKVFYLFISTIGILGNSAIVYVTFRSRNRKLRSVCNIFIALVSAGDVLHHIGQYLMIATHDLSVTHFITNKDCAMLQFLPLFGICFSSFLLLNVAIDRLAAITIFYRKFEGHHKLYLLIQILPATLFATTISSLTLVQRSSENSDYRYTFNEHFRLDSIIRIAKTNFVKDTYPSRVLVTISTMPAKEQVETAIRGL